LRFCKKAKAVIFWMTAFVVQVAVAGEAPV